ncbi:hypothetical protein RCL_jg23571.t1 [Rhizophagus clarus]|uniref:Uncharacterized protein n=1 Tax=Rhizophagus clarus TaxID=94130 RepID=A0A8H3L0T2_9GLOM|nr:hypothetical protein RCL_jg23571.t1 [Rhizophagus clarus]
MKVPRKNKISSSTKQGGIEDPNNGSGDKLRIPDEDVYIYQVEAIFMPDQNTLTSCSTTSMIINEQNNDNQNIDITPDIISTPGFRSALQVAKENISLQQVLRLLEYDTDNEFK